MDLRPGPILAAVVFLAACRAPLAPSAEACLSVPLPGAPDDRLVVVGTEQEGASWQRIRSGRNLPLAVPPVTLHPVDLSISPDGRYLAVVSVGEGHPVLDVLDLARVLAGTHGDRSLLTIDPYPGSIELAGWRGGCLRVRSDRPLAEGLDASGRPPGCETDEAAKAFLVDLRTNIILQE